MPKVWRLVMASSLQISLAGNLSRKEQHLFLRAMQVGGQSHGSQGQGGAGGECWHMDKSAGSRWLTCYHLSLSAWLLSPWLLVFCDRPAINCDETCEPLRRTVNRRAASPLTPGCSRSTRVCAGRWLHKEQSGISFWCQSHDRRLAAAPAASALGPRGGVLVADGKVHCRIALSYSNCVAGEKCREKKWSFPGGVAVELEEPYASPS